MNDVISNKIGKWLYPLVFLAGVINVFAFAPFRFHYLVFFSPIVLFYALSCSTTAKQYFYISWLYGVGLFGAGASWPFYSLYFFAHAPLVMAIIGVTLFVVLVALFSTGLFGLLAAQFRYTPLALRLLLLYPVSWVFIEWTRIWLFTGFPWLYFGSGLIDTIFAAYAPVTGVFGLSFISVLIAGALLMMALITLDGNPTKFGIKLRSGIISILVISILFAGAQLLEGIHWTKKSGRPLTVSILQTNISQQEKLDPEKLEWTLNRYQEMTMQSLQSDIIVWPETALFSTFGRHMDDIILPLQKKVRSDQSIFIGGFYINQNNGVENSVLALSANSREIYSKRHLVPFGEYVPFLEYIRWMGDWIPFSNLNAGEGDGVLPVAGELAQMSICYEDAFGNEVIQSLPEATLLINMTHDGWFTGSFEPEQHMQIARMRSLETGRYMIRATTTGPAGIIDEKGRVVDTAPIYTKKIITGQVQPYIGETPYVRWGNWLIISLMSAILIIGFLWNMKRKNKWQPVKM